MNKIYVLGMGPGKREFIAPFVLICIKEVDVVIGGKRHFQEVEKEVESKEKLYIKSDLLGLVNQMKQKSDKKMAVLVSGDPGFYSFLVFLKKHFSKEELIVIPGLSSMQYMFCKVGLPWQNAFIKSLHGKSFDYIEALKDSGLVGMLTDGTQTPQCIARNLVDNGLSQTIMYVGETLSYEEEKITTMLAFELAKIKKVFAMNVVILEKGKDVSY